MNLTLNLLILAIRYVMKSHANVLPINYLPLCSQAESFFLFPTCSSEIEEEISNLNINEASGPFSVYLQKSLSSSKIYCLNVWKYYLIALSCMELSQINLKLLESFQYLKRVRRLILIIIVQYLFCQSSTESLKDSCTNA